jgi:hypothetical protein
MKKTSLTEKQKKIVSDLIAEFEGINAQKKCDHNDLFAYIDNTLNERKRIQEEIIQHNKLMCAKHLEYLASIVGDVRKMCERYNVSVDFSKSISGTMRISFYFYKSKDMFEKYGEKRVGFDCSQHVDVLIENSRIEDVMKYGEIVELRWKKSNYGYDIVKREDFPKFLADKIIEVNKTF